MRRQTDFAESMMNSATSSAVDPVTINMFQQPADAVTFSSKARIAMGTMQIA